MAPPLLAVALAPCVRVVVASGKDDVWVGPAPLGMDGENRTPVRLVLGGRLDVVERPEEGRPGMPSGLWAPSFFRERPPQPDLGGGLILRTMVPKGGHWCGSGRSWRVRS